MIGSPPSPFDENATVAELTPRVRLVIDGAAFRPADRNLFPVLKKICDDVHAVDFHPSAHTTRAGDHGLMS